MKLVFCAIAFFVVALTLWLFIQGIVASSRAIARLYVQHRVEDMISILQETSEDGTVTVDQVRKLADLMMLGDTLL